MTWKRLQSLTGSQNLMARTMNHASRPIPPIHPTLTQLMAALLQRIRRLPHNQLMAVIPSRRTTLRFQLTRLLRVVSCPPLQPRLSQLQKCRLHIHTVVTTDTPIQTDPVPLLLGAIQFTTRIRITHLVFLPEWPIRLQQLQILGFLQWKDTGTPVVPRPGILIANLVKSANVSC